ncbi:hypothetical protein F66182_2473 [Fusarium sp. NRRL 66182]|nr:hypothetical protein F66182_2473 [Fusarium sp. NRRL 66182]
MRLSPSLVALLALASLSVAEPKSAEDGPTKLDDCGCWPIYQAMLKCQKLRGPGANTRECVCIDNPDGWYPSMDGCRNCLAPGSLSDDFFDNVSRLVTQLFVSCTNAGGGVTSDGSSICASNAYREACVSLGTNGRASWASYEMFESNTKGNSSYVLEIAEYSDEEEASMSRPDTPVKTTASNPVRVTQASSTARTTSSNAEEPLSADSEPSDDASETETGSAPAITTPSTALGLIGAGAVPGVVCGGMIAVAVGAILF